MDQTQDSFAHMSEVQLPPPEKKGGRVDPLRLRALEEGEPRHFATFIKQHPFNFSLLALIAYLIALLMGGYAPNLVNIQALGIYAVSVKEMISHLVSATFALAFLLWLGWARVSGFTPVRQWRQINLFWPTLLYLYIVIQLNLPSFDFSDLLRTTIGLIDSMLTGIAEEVLFRGVILYTLLFVWWKSPGGIFNAVFISSLLFSLTHLLNIFVNPLQATLIQVMYALFYGILFSALLLRTNQLWLVILLHGAIDVISVGLSKPSPTTPPVPVTPIPPPTPGQIVTNVIFYLILTFPLAIYGWYLIRRSR